MMMMLPMPDMYMFAIILKQQRKKYFRDDITVEETN
jgi:hypothetical protein